MWPSCTLHAEKQWSPVGAIKSHARTPSVSKIGATPRATPSTLAGRRHVSVGSAFSFFISFSFSLFLVAAFLRSLSLSAAGRCARLPRGAVRCQVLPTPPPQRHTGFWPPWARSLLLCRCVATRLCSLRLSSSTAVASTLTCCCRCCCWLYDTERQVDGRPLHAEDAGQAPLGDAVVVSGCREWTRKEALC